MFKKSFILWGLSCIFLLIAGCSPVSISATANPSIAPSVTIPSTANPPLRPPLEPSPTLVPSVRTETTALPPSPTSTLPKAQVTALADWDTYTNQALGFSLDYPPGWSFDESAGRVVFTSPEGARIVLAVVDTGSLTPQEFLEKEPLPNTRCSTQTNPQGIAIQTCFDTLALSTTAYFSLPGGSQLLSLSIMRSGNPDVFNIMLDTLRPAG